MDDSRVWRSPRIIVLLAVLSLHAALLALLVIASRTRPIAAWTPEPIEVMMLPPVKTPRVRVDNVHPEPASTRVLTALAPPALDGSTLSGASPGPEGHGVGVNWAAEAHRALRAYEIRRDQPPSRDQDRVLIICRS